MTIITVSPAQVIDQSIEVFIDVSFGNSSQELHVFNGDGTGSSTQATFLSQTGNTAKYSVEMSLSKQRSNLYAQSRSQGVSSGNSYQFTVDLQLLSPPVITSIVETSPTEALVSIDAITVEGCLVEVYHPSEGLVNHLLGYATEVSPGKYEFTIHTPSLGAEVGAFAVLNSFGRRSVKSNTIMVS